MGKSRQEKEMLEDLRSESRRLEEDERGRLIQRQRKSRARKSLTPKKAPKGMSFGQQVKRFGRSVPPQSQQPIRRPVSPRPHPRRQNFFEHKSERDVYGDVGLTLFDSQKGNRSSHSTGNLFGFD